MKLVLGLNILIENSLDTLHRRPELKVSRFRFLLFPERNLNARMHLFCRGTRNEQSPVTEPVSCLIFLYRLKTSKC
jgi:hypothetical protein